MYKESGIIYVVHYDGVARPITYKQWKKFHRMYKKCHKYFGEVGETHFRSEDILKIGEKDAK